MGMSAEQNYYETLDSLRELRKQLSHSGDPDVKTEHLEGVLETVWDKAKELDDLLCSDEFEEVLP